MKLRRSKTDLPTPSAVACLLVAALAWGGAACQMIAGIRDVTLGTGGAGGTGGKGGAGGKGGTGGMGGADAGPSCFATAIAPPGICDFSGSIFTIAADLQAFYTCAYIAGLRSATDKDPNTRTGGIQVAKDDPNTLLVVRGSATSGGSLYRVPLLRDEACHVAGIGTGAKIADLDYVDGITQDPKGALLFGKANDPPWDGLPLMTGLARMKMGSSTLDDSDAVDFGTFGVSAPVTAVGFVPSELPGGGNLVFTTSGSSESKWYSVKLAGDGTGPLNEEVQGVTAHADLYAPRGFAFLRAGSPTFTTNTVILAGGQRAIFAYAMTPSGAPDLNTARMILQFSDPSEGGSESDLEPWGIALDPVSGDLLMVLQGSQDLIALRGFSP